jgi:hypothetical protein
MSRIALETPDVVVLDDVLPQAAFAALTSHVASRQYRSVHAHHWDKAWRLGDGSPMRGESVYFDPAGVFHWDGATYPTGTPVDAVFDSVRESASSHPLIAGREGVDWVAMFLASWLYPVGSALSLHRDTGDYSGSFTFFAHTEWRLHWGGALLVLQDWQSEVNRDLAPGDSLLISDEDGLEARHPGIATCVVPRPNRLVLLGPRCPHMIGRVDQNAGAHVRASVAGFFLHSP